MSTALLLTIALACGGSPPAVEAPQASAAPAPRDHPKADWNNEGVAWRQLEAGLAEAKATDKPVLLVVYTTWCPHCVNYSHVFKDPEVQALSERFVMVRMDADQAPEAARYAPDGEYIPRTMVLDPDGAIRTDLTGPHSSYRHFIDEHDPSELIAMMMAALRE